MEFPNVHISNGKPIILDKYALDFSFPPDDFQLHAFNAIEENRDVLVCAPTASGKTLVAQYAIAHTIKKGMNVVCTDNELGEDKTNNITSRVVYATPIKVLSNQNYADLKPILEPMNMTVGISTGDIKIDEDAHCVVATAEILRNSMYQLNQSVEDSRKKINKDFIDSLGCIIVDEAHYMNDKDRGRVWEEIIILAKPNVLMIFLSATLSLPEKFAEWISMCRQRPISLITVEQRKVPLKHHLLVNKCNLETLEVTKELCEIMNEKNVYNHDEFKRAFDIHENWKKAMQKKGKSINTPNAMIGVIKWLKDNNLLPSICFVFSKRECEKLANSVGLDLTDHDEKHKINTIFDKHLQPHMKKYENVGQIEIIRSMLLKGISYHHSGMLSIIKEIIEIIYKEGLVKILFCTETFAVGINGPTKCVIFSDVVKHTNTGKRLLEPAEYKQMAGRAGRRGLDTNGTVIILFRTDFPDEQNIKSIMCGKVPEITSNFKWDYQFFLKIIQSNITNINLFFKKSLVNMENEIILNGLKNEKIALTLEIDYLIKIINENNKSNEVDKLINYENQLNSDMFGSIKINLSKKQLTEYQKLKKMLQLNDFKYLYENKIKLNKLENKLQILNQDISSYEMYVNTFCSKIQTLLIKWKYLLPNNSNNNQTNDSNDDQNLSKLNIDVRGVIAANINECNPIILTEMICDGYFDNLTLEEIISFISIFTEPIKSSNRFDFSKELLEVSEFTGTSSLNPKIFRLIDMIKIKQNEEDDEFGVGFGFSDWSISTDYLDISYMWACGLDVKSTLEHLAILEEYEGNFVKNMLKICNIVHDVYSVCKMIGKVELLPILENVDNLILRDIVTITSLYLK